MMIAYNLGRVLHTDRRFVYRFFYAVVFVLFVMPCVLKAVPLNNVFDSAPVYNPMGCDKYYAGNCPRFAFNISPLYQHTQSARNGASAKVAAGERLGEWRFMPVLFDIQNAAEKVFEQAPEKDGNLSVGSYTQLFNARKAIWAMKNADSSSETYLNDKYHFVNDKRMADAYNPDMGNKRPNPATQIDDEEFRFDPSDTNRKYFTYKQVQATYERFGLRGQAMVSLWYFGASVRAGVADVRQKPVFVLQDVPTPSETDPSVPTNHEILYQTAVLNMLSDKARMAIGKELGIDMESFCGTYPEDTHVEVFWQMPFSCYDEKCQPSFTFAPFLSVGAWVPTGREQKANKVFSVPTGNDGFFGITAEGAMSFIFPGVIKNQSVEYALGGGGLFIPSSRKKEYRVPSSKCQSGLYPWKIALTNQPGITWYVNSSLKGENFIDGLSCFFDYVYTHHMRDEFKLDKADLGKRSAEEITAREEVFKKADSMERLAEESKWTTQVVNFGFNYHIASCVSVGFVVQGHIKGTRVYKPETVMGSVTFEF